MRVGEPSMHVMQPLTYLQISDIKWLFKDVGSISSGCKSPHVGQVATVSTHGLNDEHPALGPTGRLFNAVTRLVTDTEISHLNPGPWIGLHVHQPRACSPHKLQQVPPQTQACVQKQALATERPNGKTAQVQTARISVITWWRWGPG